MNMDELRELASQTVNDIPLEDPDLDRMTLLRAILASSL
jgi:hypothetical protein